MKTILLILFLFTACPYGISFGQDEFFFLFDEDLEAPSPTATSNNYYWFDGVNDIMVMATQDTVAAGAFSLEWYGAIYDFSTYPHLFCGWINGNTPDNTLSYLRWTNTGAFMNGETQTNADAFQLDYAFQDSTLYDVVVTWASDKEWKMYVNGTLADSATTSDDTIRVKQLGGLVASRQFEGKWYQMRTFNYTLNQTEITALYNSGNPQDLDVTTVKAYTSDATAGCRFDYNNRNMGASTWQSSGTVSNTISVYGCNLITP